MNYVKDKQSCDTKGKKCVCDREARERAGEIECLETYARWGVKISKMDKIKDDYSENNCKYIVFNTLFFELMDSVHIFKSNATVFHYWQHHCSRYYSTS